MSKGSPERPFKLQFSFHKILEKLEFLAGSGEGWRNSNARKMLKRIDSVPVLKGADITVDDLEKYKENISELLGELFPGHLDDEEIKSVCLPFQDKHFNKTRLFVNILREAGDKFNLGIRDFDEHQLYAQSCCLILNSLYGTRINFSRPLFYDIPTADGVIRHYKILYSDHFMEVLETPDSPKLTQADIDELIDNYDNLPLWKKKFPPGGWIVKGFGIMNLVDVTAESAISGLKDNLLGDRFLLLTENNLNQVFRSLFNSAKIQVGFSDFDQDRQVFENAMYGLQLPGFLLANQELLKRHPLVGDWLERSLKGEQGYLAVSNFPNWQRANPEDGWAKNMADRFIGSFILAPIIREGKLLGVFELISPEKKELNSIAAKKLDIIMPLLAEAIDRRIKELYDKIRVIIQEHYTTLHPSVYWKFRSEAKNYIRDNNRGLQYDLREISFSHVYPLYGQVDISGSSVARNRSIQADLFNQLSALEKIVSKLPKAYLFGNKLLSKLHGYMKEADKKFKAGTEQQIQHFIDQEIHQALIDHPEIIPADYEKNNDRTTGRFFKNRLNYEKTLLLINQKLAGVIDKRQAEIQQHFPHYFERFKTDGIDHNMYIGETIAPGLNFGPRDLRRLRLWQLRVTAEMEIEHADLKKILPFQLNVTSLILAFNGSMGIRFRMDEKHFDVDGVNNVRYEVIKKRIDKARMKYKNERITQPGKIVIVFTQRSEEAAYLENIRVLQGEGLLGQTIEQFEVEDLQGISGLNAIRVAVIANPYNLARVRSFPYDLVYERLGL